MLVEELREIVKSLDPAMKTIRKVINQRNIEEEYHRLHALVKAEDFWQNPEHTAVLKTYQQAKQQWETFKALEENYTEIQEMIEAFKDDEASLEKLKGELQSLSQTIRSFKVQLLLGEPDDNANCFLSINAGAGGTESQDWAEMLLRMYIRFCERTGLTAKIIDYQPGEAAGIKSSTLFIKGKNAYGLLKGEHGIHRLVRISPYDASKRRHTSFASVFLIPEVTTTKIVIDPNDLRIDTYRAGGAGGQHVNRTDSAVRITHLPTNIVTQCQSERSQAQNKETAMKMLMAKLEQKQRDEQKEKVAAIEKKKIEWGSQIRSYVLHPYKMIKDHRTDRESPQPDIVLDGDLMPFIEAYLVNQQT